MPPDAELSGLRMYRRTWDLRRGLPLALNDRWTVLCTALIGGLFLMQFTLAVWLKTLPTFPWLAAYVFWVPWNTVVRRSDS